MSNQQTFVDYFDEIFTEVYDVYAQINSKIKAGQTLSANLKDAIKNYFRKDATNRFLGSGDSETTGCFRGVIALTIFFSPQLNTADIIEGKVNRFIECFGDNRVEARDFAKELARQLYFRFKNAIDNLSYVHDIKNFANFFVEAIDSGIETSVRVVNILDKLDKLNFLHKLALPPEGHILYKKYSNVLEGKDGNFSIQELINEADIQVMDKTKEHPTYSKEKPLQRNSIFSCFTLYQQVPKYIPIQQIHREDDVMDGVRVLLGYQKI